MKYLLGLRSQAICRRFSQADNRRTPSAGAVGVLMFSGKGRARSWHGSLYRQRLGSGVPVINIWGSKEGITSLARETYLLPVIVEHKGGGLREKERRELAAKVTTAKDSSTSQRGVYWLAILLAAVLIISGMVVMVASAMQVRLW